ncbi:hypothetical protein [Virgibacillus necropolis]|nr:hypothetical protein [Virgibacillus necropolis]
MDLNILISSIIAATAALVAIIGGFLLYSWFWMKLSKFAFKLLNKVFSQ